FGVEEEFPYERLEALDLTNAEGYSASNSTPTVVYLPPSWWTPPLDVLNPRSLNDIAPSLLLG
ncbi:hypothetical protein U1Q18_025727, partial [Sarracenia purpurea var. burkii]